MVRALEDASGAETLEQAVQDGLKAWAIGRWVGRLPEVPHDTGEMDKELGEADIDELLKRELEGSLPEVVVLDRSGSGTNAFRQLPDDEVEPLIRSLRS